MNPTSSSADWEIAVDGGLVALIVHESKARIKREYCKITRFDGINIMKYTLLEEDPIVIRTKNERKKKFHIKPL